MRRIMEAEKDLFENDVRNSMVSASDIMRERACMDVRVRGGGYRLRNGRYANREDAFVDKYAKRIAWLEFEREKYMRAWMGVCDVLAMRERELRELKEKIQGLLK